jgi:rubrerythrin
MERQMDDDYFARLDRERIEKLRTAEAAQAEAEAREAARALHHHKCGKCGSSMDTHLHRGVQVEVCPQCGAVLLDKGELETLAGEDKSGALAGILSIFRK